MFEVSLSSATAGTMGLERERWVEGGCSRFLLRRERWVLRENDGWRGEGPMGLERERWVEGRGS